MFAPDTGFRLHSRPSQYSSIHWISGIAIERKIVVRSSIVFLILLSLLAVAGVAGQPEPDITDEEAIELLYTITENRGQPALDAMRRIRGQDDERFIAALIETQLMMVENSERVAHVETLEALSGQRLGRSWFEWRDWYANTDLEPPPGFTGWKGSIFARIDGRFRNFLWDDAASTIRVEEVVWGGVSVDGIPPLENPLVLPAAEATGMIDGEPVFGLVVNGEARAYPLRIMDQHEMANDVIGGEPVSLAYCTLCGAGIAYRTTQPDGTVFDFGTSGLLYRSNKLMYDRQTQTLWNQLTGEPVLGELVGSGIRLEVLPIVLTTWAAWREDHPETTVLDFDTGHGRQYRPGTPYSEYFTSSGTWFSTPVDDDRLEDKDWIFAIEINGSPKAYPIEAVLTEQVINDELGGIDIVITGRGERIEVSGTDRNDVDFRYDAGGAARAYERDGHSFSPGPLPDTLLDEQGQVWTVTEEALIGPADQRLSRLPGHLAFWFGWSTFFPDTELYSGG